MSLREVYDLNPVRLPRLHGMGFELFVRFLENPILGRVLGAKTLSEQAIGRRTAARTLAGAVVEADTTAPVRLLADLRDLFATTTADRLATAAIIRHLTALEDRPWADDAQGRPLTQRHLAKLLEGFRIKAKQIRQGAATRKGYLRADFTDALSPLRDGHAHLRGSRAKAT